MTDSKKDTESRILEAAEVIFQKKGYDGARMQEIADHACINKGLLHYYFKTKDRLFEAIFDKAFDNLISDINQIIIQDYSLLNKIEWFVHQYTDLLISNPGISQFVINELNRNPEHFTKRFFARVEKPNIRAFIRSTEIEIKAGEIRETDPKQLMISIISMCVFPFIGKPMFQTMFEMNNTNFYKTMEARKQHIVNFFKGALTPG